MNLSADIRKKIEKMEAAKVFGYADLDIPRSDYQTAAKALERLQKQGLISKVSKGLFYKPQPTVFGELKPDYAEQMKNYLYKGGKRVGYESGVALYNRLNLTTQVPAETRIAGGRRVNVDKGMLRAKSVKSYADVTESNYPLLGLLDALKDIKRIPDSKVATSVSILSAKIRQLTKPQVKELINYALDYPPRARALLGAILEVQQQDILLSELREQLNPLTSYKLGLDTNELPTAKNWNIK